MDWARAVGGMRVTAARASPYDRARSWERRRRLAYSGPLPPRLAARFTVGEAAALKVIADEVRAHGKCDRTLGEIAARAGVGRTTVQNAIRQAVKLGLVAVQERRRPGARSLPNVIRIVSAEWRSWLERGRKGGGFKNVNPTDKPCFFKEGKKDLSGVSPKPDQGWAREADDSLKQPFRTVSVNP